MLSKEEILSLERIYGEKFITVRKEQYRSKYNRNYTAIRMISHRDGRVTRDRQTAAWRLECILGRKLDINNGESVDHIDGDCSNDDYCNLQLMNVIDNFLKGIKSDQQNLNKNYKHEIDHRIGDNNPNRKLPDSTVVELLDDYYKNNLSIPDICNKYNIHYKTAKQICDRDARLHVEYVIPAIYTLNKGQKKGEQSGRSKLSEQDVRIIRLKRVYKFTWKKIMLDHSISESNLECILSGKSWSHVGFPFRVNILGENVILWTDRIVVYRGKSYKFIGLSDRCDIKSTIYIDKNTLELLVNV